MNTFFLTILFLFISSAQIKAATHEFILDHYQEISTRKAKNLKTGDTTTVAYSDDSAAALISQINGILAG